MSYYTMPANPNNRPTIPRAMKDHTLESIRVEITEAEQKVQEMEAKLDTALTYLGRLRERHAELVLEDVAGTNGDPAKM